MIARYENKDLTEIFSDKVKVAMWQRVELAVIKARRELGLIPSGVDILIMEALRTPVDIIRCLELEDRLKHDLNAFVTERKEKIPANLRRYFHDGMTSYDTEEPAFAIILSEAWSHISNMLTPLSGELERLAKTYRYTPMNARTHGQEAEMQSFGARVLTWYKELANVPHGDVERGLGRSKLSGAIGKYGTINPQLEEEALEILGLKPFLGATQIVPRNQYLPLAQTLCQIVQAINKIATDIRLMARSGKPLVQEPFGKRQTGSSAMPQKKNTILTEKINGMERLAKGYLLSIQENLQTWEERAIEQSSCERVAWPDLFHVTAHAIETLTKVLKGLQVYPDNMLWEIINSRGCYAAAQAKDFLKEHGVSVGIDEDSAYRIVQLAAFNVHSASEWAEMTRKVPPSSLDVADAALRNGIIEFRREEPVSIEDIIPKGELRISEQLEISEEKVSEWNRMLFELFANQKILEEWSVLFQPSYLLRNEPFLFRQILRC